jgi:hypothetical protein
VRGTNFAVTNIKTVRASGGPAPQCSLTGTPPTLACDGELPGGISVFVQLGVSGAGGSYDFALLFQPGDMNLFNVPSNQTAAPVPLGGSLGMTSATAGRVTIHNPNETQSFQRVEVAPVGFRVTNVLSPNCGITEGGGIVCQNTLAPGGARIIRFATDSLAGLSAVLPVERRLAAKLKALRRVAAATGKALTEAKAASTRAAAALLACDASLSQD